MNGNWVSCLLLHQKVIGCFVQRSSPINCLDSIYGIVKGGLFNVKHVCRLVKVGDVFFFFSLKR